MVIDHNYVNPVAEVNFKSRSASVNERGYQLILMFNSDLVPDDMIL